CPRRSVSRTSRLLCGVHHCRLTVTFLSSYFRLRSLGRRNCWWVRFEVSLDLWFVFRGYRQWCDCQVFWFSCGEFVRFIQSASSTRRRRPRYLCRLFQQRCAREKRARVGGEIAVARVIRRARCTSPSNRAACGVICAARKHIRSARNYDTTSFRDAVTKAGQHSLFERRIRFLLSERF